jgi:S-adenosylmethionine-diacylglycerol 3-amino-3-carboxypropyl transferase
LAGLRARLRPGPAPSLPPYLEAAGFGALRANAGRVRVLNRSLTEVLAVEAAGSTDGYALLDAQDWMSDAQLAALWLEVSRTARDGARVIFRTGGAADILPGRLSPDLLAGWRYDAAASAAGFAADRSAIYGGFDVYRRA